MITKSQLIQTIEDMPEKFSIGDFLDKILLLQKIEVGLNQSENGETLSTEQAKERLSVLK